MGERTDRLAALGARLGAYGFAVELTGRGLRVTDPDAPGCCEQVARAGDTITCRRRAEDGGREWFYTSWGEPVAHVERIADAVIFLLGFFAERRVAERGR